VFSHELADPSVSLPVLLKHVQTLVNRSRRFAAFLYTPEGKVVTKRVWEETLAELDFAGVRDILNHMRV
jgi:hypothetical protein